MSSKRLHMESPARSWRDALPCGNGVLGALVYGRIVKERILLNHEALWSRGNIPPVPDTSTRLAELRALLQKGDFATAERFFPSLWAADGFSAKAAHFLPGPDVGVEHHQAHPFEDYHAALDMKTGEIAVRWKENGYLLERRVFVSRPDNVMVINFKTENPDGLDVLFSLKAHDPFDSIEYGGFGGVGCPETTIESNQDGMRLNAVFADGVAYEANLKIYGTLPIPEKNELRVKGCSSVTALVSLGPVNDSLRVKKPELPKSACYETMREAHAAMHAELMDRLTFSLPSGDDSSNERMLLDVLKGPLCPALTEKLFHYGRYLMISSSSGEAVYPAHLQGLWNGDYKAAWTCGIFNNENVQMNYWGSLAGALPESLLPLFSTVESLMDDFRENARHLYGCRGILVPLFMSPRSGRKQNPLPHVVYWSAGAGWLAQHFYDYWLYTGERDFLLNHALPFMKEASIFYEDFFTEGADGYWVSAPSQSPENRPLGDFPEAGNIFVCVNATMDFSVAKELFTRLIEVSEQFDLNAGQLPRWKEFLRKIPAYRINEDGALTEWMDVRLKDNYHHRHLSHLYGLFPGREIDRHRTPELFEACRIAVEKRLVLGIEHQTGWSLSHMASLWARLGDGERSLECLQLLTRSCLGKNFFTYHNSDLDIGITKTFIQGVPAPFQIDANFGITAAVLEMLVFSRPGFIHLLPALPSSWTEGTLCGVRCPGGIALDLRWNRTRNEIAVKFSSNTDVNLQMVSGRNPKQNSLRIQAGKPLMLCAKWSAMAPSADDKYEWSETQE
ncbi:MAG: glycoside hydrolase N-terminal domain-containing protein [Kiritimatiellales bacterium]